MAKPKLDVKAFLLQKGELLVMGFAGLCLVVLLIWGVSKRSSAKDPVQIANELKGKSNAVYSGIESGTPDPADAAQLTLPPWLEKTNVFRPAKVPEFTQATPLFDPTAQPNTKRENPLVWGIGEYQVDLTRGAMLGYDITPDGNGDPLIAVLTTTAVNKPDDAKIQSAAARLKGKGDKFQANRNNLGPRQPMGPGGAPPGPGGAPPGPGGAPPGPGGPPPGPGMGGPHGFAGGGEFSDGQRVEKSIKYVALKEIDESVRKGNLPAFTVIPLRLVTVHAVVPYKKQVDEIKRALRLPNPPAILDGSGKVTNKAEIEAAEAEARKWGPWYDGFEVQRRVTRVLPNGQLQVVQDWPDKPADPKDTSGNYKFEELYIEKIDTRKIADNIEDGYIPYFLKPEMMLAMPLPQLAKDLNVKYPDIKLKDILDNIDKLKKANQKELTQSEFAKKLAGAKSTRDIYTQKTSDDVGGLGYDPTRFGPVGGPPPKAGGMGGMGMGNQPGGPQLPEGYGATGQVAVDIENFLLRFVDCDARPGYTYEYRIRLRMWNPNYKQDKAVANPEYAKDTFKILYSKWTQTDPITVPAESFLFAQDVKAYRDKIDSEYPAANRPSDGVKATDETKAVNALLQVKENQAVVQVATWMEQVRTGTASQREPVGAWVVAEMPVGRGEFVGRKQFIKLPLWSSEKQEYLLREVGDKVIKGKYQPRGWLVDFSTKSVLVDFEGGRVKTKVSTRFDEKGNLVSGTRTIDEDAATELLILRPDGKLIVRSSQADDADLNRKTIVTEWNRWVKEVEQRKSAGTGDGKDDMMNPFLPPPKK